MKRCFSFLLSLTFIVLFTGSVLSQGNADAGFEKLKSLVGEWQGAGPNDLQISVSYEMLSGGTAIMETRKPLNEPDMVSVFHLDGEKLMMTHYCSIGNQPRMRAEPVTGEVKELSFTFFDITNLTNPSDGHMRNLTITFRNKEHITQVWTWREDGKDIQAKFNLKRMAQND